jgi:hypothetical protein
MVRMRGASSSTVATIRRIDFCSTSGGAYLTVSLHPPCSTEGENNRRVVVVAVVLFHRADLPVSVKTRSWYVRTNRLPELPEEPHLLLLTEHCLAS